MCELEGNEICSVWCLTAGFNINVIKPKHDASRLLILSSNIPLREAWGSVVVKALCY